MARMHVLVTGAAGYFARLIIPALLADGRITRIVGTDRVPPPKGGYADNPRYHHVVMDLIQARAADWEGLLHGVDLVYHLAFQIAPKPGEDTKPTNVGGQEALLTTALAAPRRVIVASAIAAYGFAPGRDAVNGMIDEAMPFTPRTGVDYADHKQVLEALLDRLEPGSPATVVRARPVNVVGPGMPLERAPLLSAPAIFVPITDHPIRQQMLYEEDLTRAMLHLIDVPAGAYNIGPDDWLTLDEAAKLLGRKLVRMPSWALRGLADMAWRTGQNAFDASWLTFFERPPIIVTSAKLKATGWAPRFGSREALMLLAGKARAGL
ncbi:MAG: NAD-dependent epimerase/dehydratase [Cyanobacteria bacterium RYN_339]|nr:NAD-dependent epimerase/dehydratase [Cyanobacteria bacterium RYN_339]